MFHSNLASAQELDEKLLRAAKDGNPKEAKAQAKDHLGAGWLKPTLSRKGSEKIRVSQGRDFPLITVAKESEQVDPG